MLSGQSFSVQSEDEKCFRRNQKKTESSLSKLYNHRKTLTEKNAEKVPLTGGFTLCGVPLCNRQDLISVGKKICEWFTHGLQLCPR